MSATPASSPPLILGSKSATRRAILEELGLTFRVEPADIDEEAIGNRAGDAEALVLELGIAKAAALRERLQGQEPSGTLLLTGDQVVVQGSEMLEKPRSLDEARTFIKRYIPGAPCGTVGSCVLTDLETGEQASGVDRTEIHFKAIPDDIIDILMEEGMVLNCAGGLMIEHPLVQPFIERIEGDVDSVMGLSKRLTRKLLKEIQGKK